MALRHVHRLIKYGKDTRYSEVSQHRGQGTAALPVTRLTTCLACLATPCGGCHGFQDCVSTHDRVMLKAVSCDRLAQAMELVEGHSVVGVDEGQFFPDVGATPFGASARTVSPARVPARLIRAGA